MESRYSLIAESICRQAIDFPTVDALNKYMREHPDGDKRNHRIVKNKPVPKKIEHEMIHQEVRNHLTGVASFTKKGGWKTREGKPLPPHVRNRSIPPAWKTIRFDPNPKAELVAQGHDVKGRLQSKYSESHNMKMAAVKFARISELIKKKDAIKKENDAKLKDKKTVEDAACLRLIMETGIRPGSDKDTKAKKHAYGATTLEGKHVVQEKDGLHLKFVGKKGVSLDIPVRDKTTADDLKKRAKEAGKEGKLFETSEGHLLEYTHSMDGGMFKTKDMRTMVGTSVAIQEVRKHSAPDNPKDYKRLVMDVASVVSSRLGNTPTVALQSYINPIVFAPWRRVEWAMGGKNG